MCKVIIFSDISHVCDVKKDANDNQITYGTKKYPAILFTGKNNIVTTTAKIANNIRVTVANSLLG